MLTDILLILAGIATLAVVVNIGNGRCRKAEAPYLHPDDPRYRGPHEPR